MTQNDATTILAIATLAALADGQQDGDEQARIAQAAASLGLTDAGDVIRQASSGERTLSSLTASLSDAEARQLAYDTAAAVCHANGWVNPSEAAFLRELASLVGADISAHEDAIATVNRAVGDPGTAANATAPSALDQLILDQAMLTAALEILPDRLANLGILPLQLRLVHRIGQSHGQQLDAAQVKDLAATLGLGAAAQVLEKVVRRTFGGLAGGLLGALGGMVGGTAGSVAGLASGAAVTFAATYALGHAADQYYAQGRQLSTDDLKALFARFRTDADTIFPRVEARIRELARGNSIGNVLSAIR